MQSSDDFPTPYGPNINKTWEIRVREGYRVHLHFTTFDLEDSNDEDQGGACAYDYVQVKTHELTLILCEVKRNNTMLVFN